MRAKVFRLPQSDESREIDFIVDTGATFPVIPRSTAEELGIAPVERKAFTPADGRSVVRDIAWAGITYIIGDKILGGTATWGELLRTLGFAQSPGVLMILGIVPILGGLARLIVAIWLLVAGIIAIRQALDFSTGKAILTGVLGWCVLMALAMLTGGGRWFT